MVKLKIIKPLTYNITWSNHEMIKPLRMKPFYEFPKPLQFFGTRDATGMRMKQEMELNLMQ